MYMYPICSIPTELYFKHASMSHRPPSTPSPVGIVDISTPGDAPALPTVVRLATVSTSRIKESKKHRLIQKVLCITGLCGHPPTPPPLKEPAVCGSCLLFRAFAVLWAHDLHLRTAKCVSGKKWFISSFSGSKHSPHFTIHHKESPTSRCQTLKLQCIKSLKKFVRFFLIAFCDHSWFLWSQKFWHHVSISLPLTRTVNYKCWLERAKISPLCTTMR